MRDGHLNITEQQEQTAVLEATKAYVRGITKLTDVTCRVERLEGAFARVSAKSASAEPIWGFAKKQDGKWAVLAMGTYFDADFHKKHGIPAGLQKA